MEKIRRLHKNETTFNVKEYRVDGQTSHISQVTSRKLFDYVKHVTLNFANLSVEPLPKELDIFGQPYSLEDDNQTNKVDNSGLLSCEKLHIRDLRKLQTPFSSRNQPAVVVRLYAIMISMDPLRCIVLHDRLILLLPDGADSDLDELSSRLYESIGDSDDSNSRSEDDDDEEEDEDDLFDDGAIFSAERYNSMKLFPFRAVEAIIATVVTNLESDLEQATEDVKQVLRGLHSKHSATAIKTLDALRILKNKLATQEARAHMTKLALENILNDDEDMALMCFVQPPDEVAKANERKGGREGTQEVNACSNDELTSESPRSLKLERRRLLNRYEAIHERIRQGPLPLSLKRAAAAPIPALTGEPCLGPKTEIRLHEHDVFEILFEGFSQNVSTVETSLELLRTEIVNGEQFHELCLTTARNKLLATTLGFTIISMCTGVGSFLGSIFGMNVINGLEEEEGVFSIIAIASSSFIVVASLGLYYTFAWAGILGGVS